MAPNDQQDAAAAGQGSTGTPTPGAESGGSPGQQRGSLTRRDAWDDPLTGLFGGSPFALFRRLSDDMDRLLFGGGGQGLATFGAALGGRFLPNVDVSERDGKLLISADLPGVALDDFHVEIEDQSLVLEGERRNQHEDTRGGVRRVERSYGTFRRVIPLPPGANAEAAQARFDNGVLQIEMPFQQQSRNRRLEVQSGGTSGSTLSDKTRH